MANQRCPQLLLNVPQGVVDAGIAALLLPADRQASNGGMNLLHPLPLPLPPAAAIG